MHYTHPLILNSSTHKEVAARYDIWKIDKQIEIDKFAHHLNDLLLDDWRHSIISRINTENPFDKSNEK